LRSFAAITFLSTLFGVTISTPIWAGPPNASYSTVPRVVYDPGGNLTYVVTVRDAAGTPVAASPVAITFSPAADAMLCWCPTQAHPVIAGMTDADGKATFNIRAGGCLDPMFVPMPAIEVSAGGIKLAQVAGVSSDAVDLNGRLPWQGWSGGCQVTLADAVYHAGAIKLRSYRFCSDLDGDGRITLIDAVLITKPIKVGSNCN
jgi:hypothetical protein